MDRESGEVRSLPSCDAADRFRIDLVISDLDLEDSGLSLTTARGELLAVESGPGARILVQPFAPAGLLALAEGDPLDAAFDAVIGLSVTNGIPSAEEGSWSWADVPDGTYTIPTAGVGRNLTGRVTVLNGRPTVFTATLVAGNLRPRPDDSNQLAAWKRKNGQGVGSSCSPGHMFAATFGFNSGLTFVDQDSDANAWGAWQQLERSWRRWLRDFAACGDNEDGEIVITIDINYAPGNTTATPLSMDVAWTINRNSVVQVACTDTIDNFKPNDGPGGPSVTEKKRRKTLRPNPTCTGPKNWQGPNKQPPPTGGGGAITCDDDVRTITCPNGQVYESDFELTTQTSFFAECPGIARNLFVPRSYWVSEVTPTQCVDMDDLGVVYDFMLELDGVEEPCALFANTASLSLDDGNDPPGLETLDEFQGCEVGDFISTVQLDGEGTNVTQYQCSGLLCTEGQPAHDAFCDLSNVLSQWNDSCDPAAPASAACDEVAIRYCDDLNYLSGLIVRSGASAPVEIACARGGSAFPEDACEEGRVRVGNRCFEGDLDATPGDQTCDFGVRGSAWSVRGEACVLIEYRVQASVPPATKNVTLRAAWDATVRLLRNPAVDAALVVTGGLIALAVSTSIFCPACAPEILEVSSLVIEEEESGSDSCFALLRTSSGRTGEVGLPARQPLADADRQARGIGRERARQQRAGGSKEAE